MQLRSGTANDAEAIAALIASFQPELTDKPDGSGAEGYLASVSIEAERQYLASPRYAYIIAERERAMLGFIALRDVSHVFHLFVAQDYQRTGVARRLWQEAKATALKSSALRQFTVNSSLRAVATYRAFGFEPTSEVVSAHGISFVPMQLRVRENEA
jgi:GNAT superfamily N-acetyltransferase